MQLSYDVVSHGTGWAIVVTPERTRAFASKVEAYYAAVEFARELKHEGGHLVHVHVHHEQYQLPFAQAPEASGPRPPGVTRPPSAATCGSPLEVPAHARPSA